MRSADAADGETSKAFMHFWSSAASAKSDGQSEMTDRKRTLSSSLLIHICNNRELVDLTKLFRLGLTVYRLLNSGQSEMESLLIHMLLRMPSSTSDPLLTKVVPSYLSLQVDG